MPRLNRDSTIRDYQQFIKQVYGRPNELHFDLMDMVTNIQRFSMRALRGVRLGDSEKVRMNLLLSLSWFVSTLNRLHINLESATWRRYPYVCRFCGSVPCTCKTLILRGGVNVEANDAKRPAKISEYQEMFRKIYPNRASAESDAVHLAEELGAFSETLLIYRGAHDDGMMERIAIKSADLFSCMMRLFNNYEIDVAEDLSVIFAENCLECKSAPCECSFREVAGYSS